MSSLVLMQVTMTSLELVEFINSQRKEGEAVLTHADFMKKVPKVLGEGGVGNFSDTYIHPQNGQKYPCYRFPKREACLMAMSYSYDIQAKVFDRMTALEDALKGAPQIPQTLPQALRLAADLAEENTKLFTQLTIAAPKADALDRLCDTTGLFGVREAAKSLKIKQSELTTWLVDNKWAYRDARQTLQPYADKIKLNLVSEVLSKPIVGNDGCERVFTQMRITSKGIAVLAKKLSEVTA